MSPSDVSATLLISDVLPRAQRVGIFGGFTRDVDSVSARLESSSLNTTVLAPDNNAIRRLPRKPWEDPEEYKAFGANAYTGDDGSKRAQDNLRRFVEAHVIPESPWQEGKKIQTLAGNAIWFETRGGKRVVQPGEIEVVEVAETVSNGEVWVLKGVINYTR
jgi:uncharacterized surface protein with fasciclin (FAS1) repeats